MYRVIPDFPDYVAFDNGNIYSRIKHKLLKANKKHTGYYTVDLYNNSKSKSVSVHKIIASLFCENLNGKKEINHIDGDKANNAASNLEWATRAENLRHAYINGLRKQDVSPRCVIATDIETGERKIFKSIYYAARILRISQGNICMACKGQRPYAGGYYWQYEQGGK